MNEMRELTAEELAQLEGGGWNNPWIWAAAGFAIGFPLAGGAAYLAGSAAPLLWGAIGGVFGAGEGYLNAPTSSATGA